MQRFAQGTERGAMAFDELYDRYKDKTWRYFRRQLKNDFARDAQQDLWARLIERRTKYQRKNKFGGYLFSMANSVLIDIQRKQLRVVDSATDMDVDIAELQASSKTEPAQSAELERAKDALSAAISSLPQVQRNTFVLHQESGLSYAEIAEAMDTNIETVKSRLRYARSKLVDQLKEDLRHVDL